MKEDNKEVILYTLDTIKSLIITGKTNLLKALIKNKDIDPSIKDNYLINFAYNYGYFDTVKMLFLNISVYEKLELYNETLFWTLIADDRLLET